MNLTFPNRRRLLILPSLLAGALLALTGCGDKAATTDDAGSAVDAGTDAGPVVVTPSIAFIDMYSPTDLTPDGTTALLQDFSTLTYDVYLYDVATGVNAKKTATGDFTLPVLGISATKRVVGWYGTPNAQAAVWDEANGWSMLGNLFPTGCPPADSNGFDISADGHTLVGLLWENCVSHAVRWSDATGTGAFTLLSRLGTFPNGTDRATVISDDGKVAGGFVQAVAADRTPAIWNEDGSGFELDPTEQAVGEVQAISADGSTAAGVWNLDGFVWTKTGGVQNVGKLPNAMPTDSTFLNSVDASGKLVMGGCGDAFGGIMQAVVWTPAGGLQSLQDIATANGIVLPTGYLMNNVLQTSADGTVVLGNGMDSAGKLNTFVLKLPRSAYGL